jgi:hypothetical protein
MPAVIQVIHIGKAIKLIAKVLRKVSQVIMIKLFMAVSKPQEYVIQVFNLPFSPSALIPLPDKKMQNLMLLMF